MHGINGLLNQMAFLGQQRTHFGAADRIFQQAEIVVEQGFQLPDASEVAISDDIQRDHQRSLRAAFPSNQLSLAEAWLNAVLRQ